MLSKSIRKAPTEAHKDVVHPAHRVNVSLLSTPSNFFQLNEISDTNWLLAYLHLYIAVRS